VGAAAGEKKGHFGEVVPDNEVRRYLLIARVWSGNRSKRCLTAAAKQNSAVQNMDKTVHLFSVTRIDAQIFLNSLLSKVCENGFCRIKI
jgi:hypothetical protein